MDLPTRAGQVLIVGVAVSGSGSAARMVRTLRPGGVFLRGRSSADLSHVAAQIRDLRTGEDDASGIRLHVAVDQEGGKVQTLSGPGFGALPPAVEQGRWDADTLGRRTTTWVSALHGVGITLNFAPVADTVPRESAADNPPIGALGRQFGADPEAVAADVATVVRASQESGVTATLKHYPGLGRVTVNTDFSAAAIDPAASPTDPHLIPFRAGIAAGAGAVMMSSARYPNLDPVAPAVFSARIIALLRATPGFTGIVVSDDLASAIAVSQVPVGRRAVAFIAAGGDLALSVRSADAAQMRTALIAEASRSPQFRRRLDEAVLNVLVNKYRIGLLAC